MPQALQRDPQKHGLLIGTIRHVAGHPEQLYYGASADAKLLRHLGQRRTRDSHRRLICNYVVPAFGAMQIDKITYPALKVWVIEQTNRYSKDTLRLMLAAFRAMLTEAVHDGPISVNPVEHLGRFYRSGRKRKATVDPLTLEELHAIEEVCA